MRLGIMLDSLGPSQLAHGLVRTANPLLAADPTLDVVAFVRRQEPRPLPANFACVPLYEAWGYAGNVVATDLASARVLQGCLGPRKKFFYLWDLEWLRDHARGPYADMAAVYRDPSLALLCRCEGHRAAAESAWNRPVLGVVPECDAGALLRLAGGP